VDNLLQWEVTVTDGELMARVAGGDREAFGEIVNRYKRKAYFAALRRTGSHDDALDLSQDAFVRAFKHRNRFRPDASFFPWYCRILANLCANHRRETGRRASAFERIAAEKNLEPGETPESVFEREEERRRVWEALSRLQPEKREIILLREFEELSYREISEAVGCPEGTVMSRLYAARRALQEQLAVKQPCGR